MKFLGRNQVTYLKDEITLIKLNNFKKSVSLGGLWIYIKDDDVGESDFDSLFNNLFCLFIIRKKNTHTNAGWCSLRDTPMCAYLYSLLSKL